MNEVKPPVLHKNLLDRAIEYVSPARAAQRMKARGVMALAGGYFGSGGRRGRPGLANWNPGSGDADSDISPDLQDLRALSRDLVRTNPLAGGAINTVVTNVVGTGLAMQPKPDAAFLGLSEEDLKAWCDNTNRRWKLWAETTWCDITRTQNFYGLQDLAFRSAFESGDSFALTPALERAGAPSQLCIQLTEADRICNQGFGADSATRTAGVNFDTFGAPISYDICRTHPGNRYRSNLQWDTYPAFGSNGRRNVLHLFRRTRPGQARGVPYLAPVIESLKQLGRFTEAELSAAVLSAAFAIFIKMDPQAFGDMFSDDQRDKVIDRGLGWDGSVATTGSRLDSPGKVVNLLPGEEPITPDLKRPNALFDPFFLAIVRQIGVGLELPFEVLIKHFTSSYTAARAAIMDAWRFFRGRREWLGFYSQDLYQLWLDEEVANRRIAAPGYFADPMYRNAWSCAIWTGDGPGSVDPLKEIDAAVARIEQGISTIEAESLLYDGVDWETKLRQRVKEAKARREGGLELPLGAGANPAPPPPRAYPSDTAP